MNIETKKIDKDNVKEIELRKAFGWEKTDEVSERFSRSYRYYVIMARNKEMPNYSKIANLENEALELQGKIQPLKETDMGICVILFLLFIIPGILYLVFLSNKNEEICKKNNLLKSKIGGLKSQAKKLMEGK